MPNDLHARLRNLTFDAVDLQRADLSVHLDVMNLNGGLDVRGKDTVIPSLDGRIARVRVADVRHVIVEGWIQGVGATEALRLASAQELLDELEALFSPDLDPNPLAGLAADGSTRTLLCRPQPGILWPDPIVPGVHKVSVLLDSVFPNWVLS